MSMSNVTARNGSNIYEWGKEDSADKNNTEGYVLIKKGIFGRIKAMVQEIPEYVQIASYKTVKVKIDELSDSSILSLIDYFEKRREKEQVELLKKEIEFRKKRLINPNEARPASLKNSLKIKYNITKKVVKEKKYGKRNIKLPKKDFIILKVRDRDLKKLEYSTLGISIKIKFNIINPNKYMKKLVKHFKNNYYIEDDLFKEIFDKLKTLIDNYIKIRKNSFKNGEDLLSDFELKNEINILCSEYGIEIPSLTIMLKKELQMKEIGLSDESIRNIIKFPSSEQSIIAKFNEEKKAQEEASLIQKLQALHVEVLDDGTLMGLADEIAREFGNLGSSEFIKVQTLSPDVLSEICRAYTSPIKIR